MATQYTPYLADSVRTMVGGFRQGEARRAQESTNKLAGSAYMGDPQAMEQLMQINPQIGVLIQQELAKRKESEQQKQIQGQDRQRKISTEVNNDIKDMAVNISKFNTYEEAVSYAQPMFDHLLKKYPELGQNHPQLADGKFDPEDFDMIKKMSAQEQGGAYEGTGMDQQVSNFLVQGAQDPSFRNTPEYARAYQMATEPKVVRTPTGDILLRPELPSIFKAPGDNRTESEQTSNIKKSVKNDVEVIKGTEKEIKTTADEKLSYGYYTRMVSVEDTIDKLEGFDSAGLWERFKGMTNITASEPMQKYRQAADDWIRSKLRRESGAVIAKEEMDKEYEIYFPQIGDSQGVINQKKEARKTAQEAMKTASGMQFKKSEGEKPPSEQKPVINESNLTVKVGGKTWTFQSLDQLQAYKEAAGL